MKLILITCLVFIGCTNSGNKDTGTSDSTNSIVLPEGRSSDSMPGNMDSELNRGDSSAGTTQKDSAR